MSSDALVSACEAARRQEKRVGFVPTMGALHAGHLALVGEARRRAEASSAGALVVASIFVNPTQFGPHEDLSRYPRDLEGDTAKLEAEGVDLLFAPEPETMYPPGDATRVHVSRLTEVLCGHFRHGHFEGVTTVVTKLFAMVGPCVAVFGKKDYQQLAVIRRMVKDLLFPVEVVGHSIVREPDGLAMSSRNVYLSAEERRRALSLSLGLSEAWRAFDRGERVAGVLRELASREVEKHASSMDYVEVTDADSLVSFADDAQVGERALVAVACRMGKTRLIDNVVLGEDPVPVAAR